MYSSGQQKAISVIYRGHEHARVLLDFAWEISQRGGSGQKKIEMNWAAVQKGCMATGRCQDQELEMSRDSGNTQVDVIEPTK